MGLLTLHHHFFSGKYFIHGLYEKSKKNWFLVNYFSKMGWLWKLGGHKSPKKFFSNFSNFFPPSISHILLHIPPKISESTLHPSIRSYSHLKKNRIKTAKIKKCPKIPPRATQAPPTMVLGITPWGYTTPPNLVRFGDLARFMFSIVLSQIDS